ncbi:MAG TPA: dihydrolipoamide acetyltransferase family protein [Solirubrobacteraceae bacterium]
MSDVAMPRLSDSMEEGTIIRWLVGEGASVKRGQELVEIETDKASMTYEADASGVLHILAREGDTLAVGAPIAQLLAPGEQPRNPSEPTSTDEEDQTSEPAAETAREPAGPNGTGTITAPLPAGEGRRERSKASPLARRLAGAHGVDLASVTGSGPGGRIVRSDVEHATAALEQTAPTPAFQAPGTAPAKGQTQIIELSRTQALIARRMAEAKATIPEFTLQRVIDMEGAVALRAQLKSLAELEQRAVPSFNDLIVKACALALRDYPRANGTYKDARLELHPRVNVGVAVAVKDALLVPVIHDADERSVWEIAERARELASAARQGTITPPQLAGGTFSVSNLGMYGIDSFTAVINPPQAAILAVGALAPRAVVIDGELTSRNTMTVTLTCDHRILYGAQAAEFLDRVRVRLEQPISLLA